MSAVCADRDFLVGALKPSASPEEGAEMHSGKWTDRDQQNTKLVFVHVAASTVRGPEYTDITELRSNALKTRSDKEPRAKDKTFNTS